MALLVPSAAQCFAIAGPVVSILGLVWLIRHGHEVVAEIFPHWEWEKRLGWLNLRAQRQAAMLLRWTGYLVQGGLIALLAAIVWTAYDLGTFDAEASPTSLAYTLPRFAVLMGSLVIWILYLLTVLAPRVREEYERDELERFRRENPDPGEAKRPARRRGAGGITIWDSAGSPPRRR